MFSFGNSNENQKLAITTTDGPVLITAGPGTGKTYTLVQRAIYLITECGISPESIFIATFTEKAAKELITRITNELFNRNISVNINEMYIGTFHSICLRILKENMEYSRLHKNYRLLDDFDQKYMVFQNIYKFHSIPNFESVIDVSGSWRQAEYICNYVNNLSEELVAAETLIGDNDQEVKILGEILKTYKEILFENNLMDFSSIQVETYHLFIDNPTVLEKLQAQITHLMIDEYQDTNYIQEQLVFLLAGAKQNICVVGDDDQGLYRFRGATIRNILEFPQKFTPGRCKIIPLVINYRSNSDIVDFYNKWMLYTEGKAFSFNWEKFRYYKKIIPNIKSNLKSPVVVKLTAFDDTDKWYENILQFITELKESGKLQDYNQIAFLFKSVKHERVIKLADFLEKNHINVYSPRSDMYFKRFEIRLAIGCLMLMFPNYVKGLENGTYKFLKPNHIEYFRNCIILANEVVTKPENKALLKFIQQRGSEHFNLQGTTDYAYSGLLYQLFAFKPFADFLDSDIDSGVIDIRPVRNLAMLTQITGKFEYLHNIDVLNSKYINKNTELFFNLYLKLLFDGGIAEYEDDSEYAPSGCVSFLTIHQSKGMEFPVVVVDSLQNYPRKNSNDLISKIEAKYFKRPAFEPYDMMKFFDFWRLYYTAFSRAQDLLILTCNENSRTPSKYFREIYNELPSINDGCLELSEFTFKEVKDVNIKKTFSFTSHITVYETCARQYKFYKELEFMPVRTGAMLFGTLVHQTIEDIHKAALRCEEDKITTENITDWFNSNYAALSKIEHSYLAEQQKAAALKQVLRYADRQQNNWSVIQQAEVDVSLVKPDYIIEGKIDLIKGENDTVEIVDFKSERKPDLEKSKELLEKYRRQLHIYAYLVEERTGKKVSKMHLYYTGEENSVPTITFPYTKTAVEGTIAAFDDTVHKIINKNFSGCASDSNVCRNCDFRFYCSNK